MRGEIAKGAAWMVLFRLTDRAIGVVSTSLLARLLMPADFGLVAMAMSVIALIELATAFSFEIALIQKPDPRREHYDTAWTLNILTALGGAVVTAACAFPAAAFYGDARLVAVMFAICAAWVISGFENVGTVNFRRSMNFSAEFRLLATKRLISFVVTIAAALALRSYWALVAGMVTGRIAGVALSYGMQPFRPRLSLACTRELFSFSGWMLANNMIGAVLGRVPQFYVGRIFGAQTLGAYTVGSEIAQLAYTELVAPINRALIPGYARLINDPPAFKRACIDATAVILLVALPTSIGIAVLAEPVVRILLGVQWHAAVPIIQILAPAGAATALVSNNAAAYVALGRPNLATALQATRLILLATVALIFVSSHGVLAVAYAELAAGLGSLAVSLPILLRTLKLPLRDYLPRLWRPLAASCVMGLVVRFLVPVAPFESSIARAIAALVLGIAVGLTLYPVMIWALWQASGRPEGIEMLVLQRLRAALIRRPRDA